MYKYRVMIDKQKNQAFKKSLGQETPKRLNAFALYIGQDALALFASLEGDYKGLQGALQTLKDVSLGYTSDKEAKVASLFAHQVARSAKSIESAFAAKAMAYACSSVIDKKDVYKAYETLIKAYDEADIKNAKDLQDTLIQTFHELKEKP